MLPIEAMLIFQTDMFMDDDRKWRCRQLHVPQNSAPGLF